ncbi:MAG: phosphoribosylformylglycinamidine synthase subunit PurL [Thermoleophilales bacterium]|jgi:phosphoribosylformylglycinamidine synthase|nr:phosphoribosylformylglycinamidine synthase subunit PurL [Thermoleophilales bacterium]
MASKGEVGIDIHIDRVPLREADMEPFEIIISESQERMLCVVEPDKLDAVLAVCEKWEVRATSIGVVTDTRRLRVLEDGEAVGDLPVEALVDECPVYDLEPAEPDAPIYPAPPERIHPGEGPAATLVELLRSPNIASKRWAYEQYDTLVGSRTTLRSGAGDCAVLSLEPDGGQGAIAVSIDGNGRRVACDPFTGAAEAVLECAQNLACAGAEPLGLTNCLNFGNPEKPHIAWQFSRAVDGIAAACRALGVPVTGGNVSLYNEGAEGPIYPTPVIGMVGKLADPATVPSMGWRAEGDQILLVGPFAPALAGSELEKQRGGLSRGLPAIDLEAHARALEAVRALVASGAVASIHDISDGGLACALAESSIASGLGARVDAVALGAESDDIALFGEGRGGWVVSVPDAGVAEVERVAGEAGVVRLGEVAGNRLVAAATAASLDIPVSELRDAYESGVADRLR